MKTTSKSKNLFFSGVLILALSNVLIKIIGLTLKIPLHHLLGDEGMAYYNTAYDIYVWLYMLSTQGLPVAISIMIADSRAKGNFKESKRIFNISLTLCIVIGLVGMFVMIGGAEFFESAYKFDGADLSIMAIAPTLFFICISSAIRGYFQGYQNMLPTAVSQIIEALGKLTVGILFALYAIKRGYPMNVVAAYTVLGLTIGVALGMLFLAVSKFLFREGPLNEEFRLPDSDTMVPRPFKTLLFGIVAIAVPITLSASVMSFTNMIDGMILSQRLQWLGYAEEVVIKLYGNYKTLAVSMYNMPPALIYPISYSVVPLLTSAISSGDKEKSSRIISSSLRIVSIIAIPSSLGMSVLAKPILRLVFSDTKSADLAAPYLSVLSLSIFFIGMLAITNAILQANRCERKPVISIVAGSVVKLAASYILIGTPGIELYGAPIGTFLSYLTITAINFYFMAKYVGVSPKIVTVFFRPFVAGVVCALSALLSYNLIERIINPKLATILAIMIAALVYLLILLLIKGVTRSDIEMLPKGKKIYSLLHKYRLM